MLGSDLKTIFENDKPQFFEIIKALHEKKHDLVSKLLSERKYDIDQSYKQPLIDRTRRLIEAKYVYEYACKDEYLRAIEATVALYASIELRDVFFYL